jgi:hypothetical protein
VIATLILCTLGALASGDRRQRAVHAPTAVDANGVAMLYPSATGSSLWLGNQDPNSAPNFEIEENTPAVRHTDGGFQYWNVVSHPLSYASGGTGLTIRLHMYASGGKGKAQLYTWVTQSGYLFSLADVRNQEFTAYFRIHQVLYPDRLQANMKIRGGRHTGSHDPRASCTMMSFDGGSHSAMTGFHKELNHPDYDHITLAPRFAAHLAEEQWYGLKLVSYNKRGDATRVVNQLYLDTDPIDFSTGRPTNHWRLFSEYVDVEGVMLTQHDNNYAKLVDWGGWVTTLRIDGIHDIDFALLSVREIAPP